LSSVAGVRRTGTGTLAFDAKQAPDDQRQHQRKRNALSLMEPHAAYACSFRTMRRVSAVGLGLCLAIVATAAYASGSNQPTLIAALNGEPEPEQQQHGPFKPYYSGIAASGTLLVWSDWQPGDRRWHLIMRRSGQISVLPTPTGSRAIEPALGPGPSGQPMLAYVACSPSCQLFIANADGSDPHAVPGSVGASRPTIWGENVAWRLGTTRIVTSRLNGSARRTLAGVPRRKCYTRGGAPGTMCSRPEDGQVEALALYRHQLAFIDSFRLPDEYEGHEEVRIDRLSGGPQLLVAILGIGIGSETYVGPSWFGGKLYFQYQGEGVRTFLYRFDPSSGTYWRSHSQEYLSGLAMADANRAYEAEAPEPNWRCEPHCSIWLSAPLKFASTKPPVSIP
jgi:hypothetical protein